MTDPTRAALIEALTANDAEMAYKAWKDDDTAPDEIADAILAQPSMARIKAVVDAAVVWRQEWPEDSDLASTARFHAVDALLAEDSDD
jgi:hypothetical protein